MEAAAASSADAALCALNGPEYDYSRIVAPMVNQSDAPFRALCLHYGATCVFSEMLYSGRVVSQPGYLDALLPLCDDTFLQLEGADEQGSERPWTSTQPLVVQVCGNDPDILAECCRLIASTRAVHGIDLNLGCPQDKAQTEHFGSYLLDKCHWPLVFRCVAAMAQALGPWKVPLSCKIRICEGHDQASSRQHTLDFCRGLAQHGAQLITIHGRKRGSTKYRRCGPADLGLVAFIAEALRHVVPVVANGNLVAREDVAVAIRESHPARGLMSGEGILVDPAIFWPADASASPPDRATLFHEYILLSERYRLAGGWAALDGPTDGHFDKEQNRHESKQIYIARQHLAWMLGKLGHGRTVRFQHSGPFLKHAELLASLKAASSMAELDRLAQQCLRGIQGSPPYQSPLL